MRYFVGGKSGCVVESNNFPGNDGLFSGTVIKSGKGYDVGYKSNYWSVDFFKECENPNEVAYSPSQVGDREDDI